MNLSVQNFQDLKLMSKQKENKVLTFQGLISASSTQEYALDQIDPYFYIKVLLKIKTIQENLNGEQNNSLMKLNKTNNSNIQNEYVFF